MSNLDSDDEINKLVDQLETKKMVVHHEKQVLKQSQKKTAKVAKPTKSSVGSTTNSGGKEEVWMSKEFVCNSKEYTIMSIKKLYFPERVAEMVEANKGIFPSYLEDKNIYLDGSFKMDQKRLDSIMERYETGLPAIKVDAKLTFYGLYKVLNGRHRLAATILKGGVNVPVCIV